MFKKLLSYVKEYKTVSFLTPLMMAGEVVMEIVIPLVMAKIIDNGLAANDVSYVVRMGVLMIVLALVSLFFEQWEVFLVRGLQLVLRRI